MSVGLFVAHRMTGDAGDWYGRWIGIEAMAFFDGIFDYLADGVAMASYAVAQVDDIDITHGVHYVAGGAARGDGNQVMLDRGRWGRVIEGVFRAMAVGAILKLTGHAADDSVFDLLARAGMAFDAGIIRTAEGHDVDNASGAGVRAVMAV